MSGGAVRPTSALEVVTVSAVIRVCLELKHLSDAKGMFPTDASEGLAFFDRWAADVEAQAASIREIGARFRGACGLVAPEAPL